ncbi:hypothetical protein Tco_0830534 [Tanacetum coccineum]
MFGTVPSIPPPLGTNFGSHVTNVLDFDIEDFSSWKDRFLVYLNGLEPYLLEVLENKPLMPMWNDLILAHEGPSDRRDTKIAALRLKFNAFKALEAEVNATFVNNLPRKWLSMSQTQRANNSIKNDSLATLFGKYNYEEGLIDQIYELETSRFSIQASSSKALISNTHLQDNNSYVEEDTRSNSEFLADLNDEFHDKALFSNQKSFYKRSRRVGSAKKPMDKSNETFFAYGKLGKYKGLKAEIDIITKKIDAMSKGKSEKGLVAESFDWDEKSVSSDDEGVTRVKAFMAIAEDEPSVGKADARSGQWVEITMKKKAQATASENLVTASEVPDLKKP